MKSNKFFSAPIFSRLVSRADGTDNIDYAEVLKGVLSKLYKKDIGKLTALLENGETTSDSLMAAILEADQARTKTLTGEEDGKPTKFQQGYAKAKAEERAKFEAELKEEYGIDEEHEAHSLSGSELIKAIVSAKATEGAKKTKGASELTEDEIKATPAYKMLEKKWKKEISDKESEFNTQLENVKKGYQQEQTFSSFAEDALKELNALNPVFAKNSTVAQTQQKNFLNAFKGLEIRKDEDGGYTFMKDGKALEDGHANLKDWKEHVKEIAGQHFEFSNNNGGGNSGNNNEGKEGKGQQSGGGSVKYPDGYSRPKNEQEYYKITSDKSIPVATRVQISEAWNAENSPTG